MERFFKRKLSDASDSDSDEPSNETGSNNTFQRNSATTMPQHQSVAFDLQNQSSEYRIRLNASIGACRFLLNGAIPFFSHDDVTDNSTFTDLIDLFRDCNEDFHEIMLRNGIENDELMTPSAQKDVCDCFAQEVLKRIFEEIGDGVFALVFYESSEISKKGRMALVLRFVDSCGIVKERFVGLVYVTETSALSLKSAIDSLFLEYGLSLKMVRGQGYDVTTNMCDYFNGLKALIMEENSSAYYVHCFAHQLHSVVVEVAKKHIGAVNFFEMIAIVRDVVRASCTRKDTMRETQKEEVEKAIGSSEIITDSGFVVATRWNSHYETLVYLVESYSSVVDVLEYVEDEARNTSSQCQSIKVQTYFQSFEFVFFLHLMLHVLAVTNTLSQYLLRKDVSLSNVDSLVKSTKQQLQDFKANGFDLLLKNTFSFCEKHDIEVVNMEDEYVKYKRRKTNITYGHHYKFDCFTAIVDMLIQEFDDRFNEVNSELLICMSALDPRDSFRDFDISKLVRLAELYKDDFSHVDKMTLVHQLNLYIDNVRKDGRLADLNGISDLARLMVETRKHLVFPLVYRLLKLTLVLPVATATVERDFSSMEIVKLELRGLHDDEFLNDGCICVVEREVLHDVSNEDVVNRFEKMKARS